MPDAPLPSAVPSDERLRAALAGPLGAPVRRLRREPNPYASTFPSERVACLLEDGREEALFLKHDGRYTPADGHHGGVAYEAAVYDRVLRRAGVASPAFRGLLRHEAAGGAADGAGGGARAGAEAGGGATLVLEALDGALPAGKASAGGALPRAARWLGRFHRRFEAPAERAEFAFLRVYDAAYYRRWARRTLDLAAPLLPRLPWLEPLCRGFAREAAPLLLTGATVIHGEFYPHNVLERGGRTLPVDWESAAVAAGEIDLASLTERWDARTADACADAYRRARWPGGAPPGFEGRLAAARLYLHLRWLGDREEWTLAPDHRWRFERLRDAALRAGEGA